jgi:hypothetical protein
LQSRLLSTLEHHAGSMYLLQPAGTDPSSGHLADYGLARSGACRAVRDSLAPLELCPIGKVGPIVTQCR